ncbi:MAG: spore coat protein [Oscillospiraceae bacterium]|jgi:spore coat protein CotF|nr:spore coat protein [Oscillospiraceae bacterium]
MIQTHALADQEILTDVLTAQKQICGTYNTYSSECMNQSLKSDMLNILRDEQSMQSSVFGEMHKRGWYEPKPAQQQAVCQTQTKFEGVSSQLS